MWYSQLHCPRGIALHVLYCKVELLSLELGKLLFTEDSQPVIGHSQIVCLSLILVRRPIFTVWNAWYVTLCYYVTVISVVVTFIPFYTVTHMYLYAMYLI